MTIEAQAVNLTLRSPFRIAHGASVGRTNVIVRVDEGYGEAALPPYYPHTAADVTAYAEEAGPLLQTLPPGWGLDEGLDRLPPGPPPARAAFDMALHDAWARRAGRPLYALCGLDPARTPLSSVTLSIPEDDSRLDDAVRFYRRWPVLKLKLGSGDVERDVAIVRRVREQSRAALYVDANGAWTVEEAVQAILRLGALGVKLVEQPVPDREAEPWLALRAALPPERPLLFADESVQDEADLERLCGALDGVNVKLAKAGGLRPARRMIHLARTKGMRVLLGCMVETSVGITAAAHLGPLADYADLDGALLLAADPYRGAEVRHGEVRLPDGPGLGARAA